MNNMTQIQKVISNCRMFLNNKADNVSLLDNLDIEHYSHEEKATLIRNQITNLDAFNIAEVLSVAFCSQGIIDKIAVVKAAGYHTVEQGTYDMAINNVAQQISTNRELNSKLKRLRSPKQKKETADKIIELDMFKVSQVLAIAFLKKSEDVLLDFLNQSKKQKAELL